MGIIAAKFGGSSLADAGQFRKVAAIVAADPRRRFIVPSAPGKSQKRPSKITDLLFECRRKASRGRDFKAEFGEIAGRTLGIVSELKLPIDLKPELMEIERSIARGASADYAASRGEYLSGKILAALLKFPFLDAASVVRFTPDGRLDPTSTQRLMSRRFHSLKRAVLPGFYGMTEGGEIRVLSRGGSDVSGALAARAAGASLYENWTDVSGLLMADPRVVKNPKQIETVTYRELRELSYMGATVLHEEAVFPVRAAGIPVRILNTNRPQDPGTTIAAKAPPNNRHGGISAIAGKKNFTVITLEKALMNQEVGFGMKVLAAIAAHGISYEHTPTGIDSFSVVIESSRLDGKLAAVLRELKQRCEPDSIEVVPNMALIAVVGRGMAQRPGVAAKLFAALARKRVNVRMIDQGSSEINIILGVETRDFERSVRTIYDAFAG